MLSLPSSSHGHQQQDQKCNMSCEPFNLDSDYDEYVESIAPKRELVCPITQEVFRDPVVAGKIMLNCSIIY